VVLQHVIGRQVELDVNGAAIEPVAEDEPGRPEHRPHALVAGQHLGDEAPIAGGPSDQREVFEEHGGHALAVVVIGDGEGDFGFLAASQPVVLPHADRLAVCFRQQRHLHVDVLFGRPRQFIIGDERAHSEEAVVRRRVAEPVVELAQSGLVASRRRADVDRPARRQQHIASERGEQGRRHHRLGHTDLLLGTQDRPGSRFRPGTFVRPPADR
jgi:hypothetical protein